MDSMNSVALIHQVCQRFGWTITFANHAPVGPSHDPIIMVTACLEGQALPGAIKSESQSSNGKNARRIAAQLLLEHPEVAAAMQTLHINLNAGKPQAKHPNFKRNPKGFLSECMLRAINCARKLPGYEPDMFVPNFTTEHRGKAGTPIFLSKVSIKLPGFQEVCEHGIARKKKEAERNAAEAAMQNPNLEPYIQAFKASKKHVFIHPALAAADQQLAAQLDTTTTQQGQQQGPTTQAIQPAPMAPPQQLQLQQGEEEEEEEEEEETEVERAVRALVAHSAAAAAPVVSSDQPRAVQPSAVQPSADDVVMAAALLDTTLGDDLATDATLDATLDTFLGSDATLNTTLDTTLDTFMAPDVTLDTTTSTDVPTNGTKRHPDGPHHLDQPSAKRTSASPSLPGPVAASAPGPIMTAPTGHTTAPTGHTTTPAVPPSNGGPPVNTTTMRKADPHMLAPLGDDLDFIDDDFNLRTTTGCDVTPLAVTSQDPRTITGCDVKGEGHAAPDDTLMETAAEGEQGQFKDYIPVY